MVPVAYYTGDDFSQAPRIPARDIAFVDSYGHTWERGPSDPVRLSDGPGVITEIDIAAPSDAVWELVSDISFGAEFSSEFVGARWGDEVAEPHLGARFIGSNSHPRIGDWQVDCFINRYVPGEEFGWATTSLENPGARWLFQVHRIAGATRLRYSVQLGPGPSGIDAHIANNPDKEPRIIFARLDEHRRNMTNVIEAMKAAVE